MSEIELRHMRNNLEKLVREQAMAMSIALRESELRARIVSDSSPVGIFMAAPDGQVIYDNVAIRRTLGLEPNEILLERWAEAVHPDDRERVFTAWSQFVSSKRPDYNEEFQFVLPDQSVRLVHARATRILDGERLLGFAGTAEDITERKRNQLALEQSEQRFRALLENLDLIAVMLDREGNIFLCNDFLLRLTGWQREEVMHRSWFDIFLPPEIREKIKKSVFMEAIATGNVPAHYEDEIITRRGERRLIAWNNTVFRDPQGQVLSTASIGEDITEHRNAQEKAQRFGQILDESTNEIYIFDAESLHFTLVNMGAQKNLGYNMQELVNLTPLDLKPEFTRESFETLLAPLKRGELDALTFETVHLRKDGSLYPVEVRLQLTHHETPPVFVAIIRDITDRRQAEKMKEATLRQQQAIINASPVPMAVNDDQQNITFLNPAFTSTFGYTLNDIPTLADWWPKAYPDPGYRQWVADTWSATLEKSRLTGFAFPPIEFNIRCKNGTVKTTLVNAALIGESFEGNHLVVLYDITERKHAEAERERLLIELTARNIEMENFVYTISHDLKTPLVTIGGFASLLEKDLARGDSASVTESLGEINKATAQLHQHINDLLLLSRTGEIISEKQDVDMNVLLNEIKTRCANQITKAHASVHIVPDIPRLRIDPERIGQALLNLIENAIKYHRPGIPPVIEIGYESGADQFRLYVRDNGVGIKKEYWERIFALFQRLDTRTEGTGVGLTIARRIVEVHEGRIRVESEPGVGTTFWIELPASVRVVDRNTTESGTVS